VIVPVVAAGSDDPMSPPLKKKRRPDGTPLRDHNKEAIMARALTLSALYILSIGTLFGAYALTL
jgi:hypothetical protein